MYSKGGNTSFLWIGSQQLDTRLVGKTCPTIDKSWVARNNIPWGERMLICSCRFAWLVSNDLIHTSYFWGFQHASKDNSSKRGMVCLSWVFRRCLQLRHPFFDIYSFGTQNKFLPILSSKFFGHICGDVRPHKSKMSTICRYIPQHGILTRG